MGNLHAFMVVLFMFKLDRFNMNKVTAKMCNLPCDVSSTHPNAQALQCPMLSSLLIASRPESLSKPQSATVFCACIFKHDSRGVNLVSLVGEITLLLG